MSAGAGLDLLAHSGVEHLTTTEACSSLCLHCPQGSHNGIHTREITRVHTADYHTIVNTLRGALQSFPPVEGLT